MSNPFEDEKQSLLSAPSIPQVDPSLVGERPKNWYAYFFEFSRNKTETEQAKMLSGSTPQYKN
jgi:hypothetical protein